MADEMLGKVEKAPTTITLWRLACAQTVSIKGNCITIKMTGDKVHIIVAGSTGITTTGKTPVLGQTRRIR